MQQIKKNDQDAVRTQENGMRSDEGLSAKAAKLTEVLTPAMDELARAVGGSVEMEMEMSRLSSLPKAGHIVSR